MSNIASNLTKNQKVVLDVLEEAMNLKNHLGKSTTERYIPFGIYGTDKDIFKPIVKMLFELKIREMDYLNDV